MFGSEAVAQIQNISLSNNIIRRRIQDMSQGIEKCWRKKIKGSNGFWVQTDEFTDTSGKCYLVEFICFVDNDNVIEHVFFFAAKI